MLTIEECCAALALAQHVRAEQAVTALITDTKLCRTPWAHNLEMLQLNSNLSAAD